MKSQFKSATSIFTRLIAAAVTVPLSISASLAGNFDGKWSGKWGGKSPGAFRQLVVSPNFDPARAGAWRQFFPIMASNGLISAAQKSQLNKCFNGVKLLPCMTEAGFCRTHKSALSGIPGGSILVFGNPFQITLKIGPASYTAPPPKNGMLLSVWAKCR